MRTLIALFTMTALLGVAATAPCGRSPIVRPQDQPSVANPPVWQADAALLRLLDRPSGVKSYQIRLPKGMTLRQQTRGNATIFLWTGKGGDPAPTLTIMTATLAPKTAPVDPEQMLEGGMRQKHYRLRQFEHLSAQKGKIGRLVFYRTYWRGVDRNQRNIEGFTYVALDANRLISINGQAARSEAAAQPAPDPEDKSEQEQPQESRKADAAPVTLSLLGAAALSFRKS